MLKHNLASVSVVAIVAVACGARTPLTSVELDAGEDAAVVHEAGVRDCPPECYAGHECCAGSCGAPPVDMPSDCCSCLLGEVDSRTCGHLCGK